MPWRLLRLGRGGELGLELLLPSLEREQLVLQGPRRHTVRDRLHDPSEPSLDLGQLQAQPVPPGALIATHPIELAQVLGAELPQQLRVHQLVPQGIEHRRLEPVAPDVPAVAADGGTPASMRC
jgi:hypothetical protein